ncbi:MAG TPA: OB-fold domain-containing protein [Solirubrobacterales bacterium]|nr:OB-fold domain-containing protein [Solirubrobacterales bacterium]
MSEATIEQAPRPILPTLTDLNRPFWEGAAAGELRLQRCSDCSFLRYPISPTCPRCLGRRYEWERMSGHGEVASVIVFHQKYHPYWAQFVPYAVALIQLEEGARMFGDLPWDDPTQVKVGDEVEVAFDDRLELTIPRWRLKPA